MDMLSALPDSLLLSILLLLPAKDAIRTSALSSRWRHLWKDNPLRLLIQSDLNRCYRVNLAAARVALLHPGPIHSLSVNEFHTPFEVDNLIEIVAGKGVRELDLGFGHRRQRYRLPLVLNQCQTLRRVSLSGCFFPCSPHLNCSFPNLRELILESVLLWDDLLQCILKSCEQLEVLELVNCDELQCVRINCAKLRKLTLRESRRGYVDELAVEYAPELRSLRLGERTVERTTISVDHAPKLEALGFFSMDATIRIGNTFIKLDDQVEMSVNKTMLLHTVKKLAVPVDFSECSLLPEVLSCFPCLETLYIKSNTSSRECLDAGLWEQQIPFDFLECNLKSVIMVNVCGWRPETEFVKFLVEHGRVLERITVVCKYKLSGASWEKTILRGFNLRNCASMDLEVEFLSKDEFDSSTCDWTSLIYRQQTY